MAAAQPIRTNWHPDKRHSDLERWVCIYPAYLNSKKTRQEGRRLPKHQCVENPTFGQIRDVLCVTEMKCVVENKLYSRERSREPQYIGRVRVQMRNDDGTPCNPELKTRDDILLFVAQRIPLLKAYQNRKPSEANQAASGANAASSSSGGGGGNKKRKNKRH